jgi:choloylglycine hydrolase
LTGLPGDSSPPSRFVRATAYVASLVPVATAADLDQAVLHVLNVFDIPLGSIRGAAGTAATDDHTLWSTVSNLADTTYSFRGYTNPNTLRIDLKTTDFTAGPPREVPLPDGDFASLAV